ncbi:MAG TPA: TonB-dependent receptor [Chitinophagaceae bacterium]|jgi:TonB-linked SusC/RagA family outer membrane protein|nr:TonB-dependent receptor [Chitinophagaceae bacterium]
MKRKTAFARSGVLLILFFSVTTFAFSQNNFKVSGKVTDDAGKPVSGATVLVKGTNIATATTTEGLFALNAPSGNSVLVISSVGFSELEVAVNNRNEIPISLVNLATSLQDVVVVGYGSQKKKSVTGAVSKLKNENFDERPIMRVDQAMVGQLAGVTVRQNTGIPGKGFSIQVRGSGSISGGNEPLYVVDGFPLSVNSSNSGNGTFSTGNPLDNINPNDIESIEVLKDAAAAAIYGSRASNGVVLITTKRGQVGKAKITFNAYGGYNEASKKLEMMNGDQWIAQAVEVINAQYVAQYGSTGATANDDYATRLAKVGSLNPNYIADPRWSMPGHPGLRYIDWQDEIERKGPIQNYEISASGGTDAVRYFISGNYGANDAFIMNVGYKVYSIRANVDVNVSKKIKLGVSILPSYSITEDPGIDSKDAVFHQALSLAPVQEDTMGVFVNTGKNGQYLWSSTTNSPVGKLTYNKGVTKRYRTIGSMYGEWQIINGLNLRSSVNLDNTDNATSTYVPYVTTGTQANRTFTGANNLLTGTSGTYNSYRRQTFVNENTLSYTKMFDKYHSSLNALAGFAYNWDRFDRTTLSSSGGYTSAVIQTLNAAAAVTGNTTATENVLTSFFGRLQYGYKDKYFLAASIRRDGSSRFGANTKYGTFPSVSLKWVVTDENFMKGIDFLSDLKLRVSYGVNGNNNLPNDYPWAATIGSFGYPLGAPAAAIGQAPNVLANPDLKWEKSQTYDIGFDFGILKNRITGSFDYYNKLNTDLLLNVQALGVTGFPSYLTNIGEVRNIGQELEITSRNIVGKVQWTTSVNLTHNTNKIEALAPGQTQVIIPNGFTVSDQILRVGSPLNSIYVLKVLGFLTAKDIVDNVPRYGNEQPGDFKFQDLNKDGIITEADKQIVGHPNPDYTWGMTNTVRYKGFDLNVLIQGQWGGQIYSQLGRAISRPGQGRSDNHPASFVDRWYSETNQGEGRFGKAYSTYNNPITAATDWLYSSDYFRVRNISLGYNLKTLFKSQAIHEARIYFTLENFFGHDKYVNGLNPEAANTTVSTNGSYPEAGDYGGIPLPKSLIFGLSFTF